MSNGGGGGGMFGGMFESIGSYVGAKKSEHYMKRYERLARGAATLQLQQARTLWDKYLAEYAPIETGLTKEAQLPTEKQPGFLKSMGDLERSYANMGGNLRRTMAGRYPSGAGIESESMKNLYLNKAKGRSDIWNQFDVQRFQNLFSLANLGRGLSTGTTAAAGGAGSISTALTSLFAQLANQNYQKSAQSGGQAVGSLAGMFSGGGGGGGGGGGSYYSHMGGF